MVIPSALCGESLMVESATGTGKTHAFLLPILQNIDEENKDVQVVIFSPTRELAMQLYNVCIELTKFSEKEIEVARAIGGVDSESEIKKYEKNNLILLSAQ
ncbi:MAG: DEAD/DEAH box helicase [Bacilli bacterium]